jgi:hypothetical protein
MRDKDDGWSRCLKGYVCRWLSLRPTRVYRMANKFSVGVAPAAAQKKDFFSGLLLVDLETFTISETLLLASTALSNQLPVPAKDLKSISGGSHI